MSFLIVVIVVLLERFTGLLQYFHPDRALQDVFQKYTPALSAKFTWLSIVILALLPAVGLLALLIFFHASFFIVFSLSFFAVIFAFGRDDWRSDIESLKLSFIKQDAEGALLKLNRIEPGMTQRELNSLEDVWGQVRDTILYRHLESNYVVLFWFFVFGPSLVVFYRLCFELSKQEGISAELDAQLQKVVWAIEWLPVRAVSFLFCVVGDFSSCIRKLQSLFLDVEQSSSQVLAACVEEAMYLGQGPEWVYPAQEVAVVAERVDDAALQKKNYQVALQNCANLQGLMGRVDVALLVTMAIVTLF